MLNHRGIFVDSELSLLLVTAASIGFLHTLFGPDHYLPFVVMARARRWSLWKTTSITFLCGVGHVGSSVVLGVIGVALGIAVNKLVAIESFRGDIAAWALIAFGLVYFVWGTRQAIRNKPHQHLHSHAGGCDHEHVHAHQSEHLHAHVAEEAEQEKFNVTPWVLFTIFVFGPCEPLIPLLMYPAAKGSLWGLASVTAVFGAMTIATRLGIALLSAYGIGFVRMSKLERYTHALAGATICMCGVSIQFLGL
jgi:nickel/cobalt transporter (NicO) family protein